MRRLRLTATLVLVVCASPARAAESTRAVASPLGGNGHNVSFDGRLFVVTRGGPGGVGWYATMLRPERVTRDGSGFPDVGQAFSDFALIQPSTSNENALALCEPDPSRAPYRCNLDGGANSSGDHDCYDLYVFDSDALATGGQNILRRRHLSVAVSNPRSPDAALARWEWGPLEQVQTLMRGIEPTVTRDGRLLVYQGHPSNDGQIDILVYSTNAAPCALTGWAAPRNVTAMSTDPNAVGRWRLAERPLRASDGTVFAAGDRLHGAYPWLFPEGDAIIFTGANMPCRSTQPEDPPGCGPRRSALSIIGYPTTWGVAHIDGEVNPSTADTVRLFFSSPGPHTFAQLPATRGVDVWPFFGSNTSNYTEIILDDGLDGSYAGIWHMNEIVDRDGNLDARRTPDTSGYFNTGRLEDGSFFPPANNGPRSKALELDGVSGRVRITHNASLNPVNAISVMLRMLPASDPDCDAENNYRLLLGKGNIGDGAYTLVFEENRGFQARVKVGGQQYSLWSNATIPVGAWSEVAFTYEGSTGQMAFFIDGRETARVSHSPGALDGSPHDLTIGGAGGSSACPAGNGNFAGRIDEVRISRSVRYGAPVPPLPEDASVSDAAAAADALVSMDVAEAPDAGAAEDGSAVALDAALADTGGAVADASSPADAGASPDLGAVEDRDASAGTSDGGAAASGGDAAGRPPASDTGCGCSTSRGREPRASGWLAITLAIAARVVARRRRAQGGSTGSGCRGP